MILFKPEHVEPILNGRKTQTRRGGKKRWNVGAVHQCRTNMIQRSSTFAHVEILRVRREPLGDITHEDAQAEGYETVAAYFQAWRRINKRFDLSEEVWVVDFKLVDQAEPRK